MFAITNALILFAFTAPSRPATTTFASAAQSSQETGKGKETTRSDIFAVTGVGTIDEKEGLIIDKLGFLVECAAGMKAPANGRTVAFTGYLTEGKGRDGKSQSKIVMQTWQAHKSISKRTPHLDFIADGVIHDDAFVSGGVKIELNYIPQEVQDAKRVRATGILIIGDNSYRYFINRLEEIK